MLHLLYETDLGTRRNGEPSPGNQRGQAMLEYVITVLMASLGLIGVGRLMHAAIGRYLLEIYFITSLPVP